MKTKSIGKLLIELQNYTDNDVIAEQINNLAYELNDELDYPSEKTYWLKEGVCQVQGLFDLLMRIKKSYLMHIDVHDFIEENNVLSDKTSYFLQRLLNKAVEEQEPVNQVDLFHAIENLELIHLSFFGLLDILPENHDKYLDEITELHIKYSHPDKFARHE